MEPNVELITYTPEPDYVVYLAARTCYSQDINYDIKYKKYNQEQIEKLLDQVKKSGHHSVFEHVSFTFAIKNVSRAFLAQVTRHRIGVSFCVSGDTIIPSYKSGHGVPKKRTIREIYQWSQDNMKKVYVSQLSLRSVDEVTLSIVPNKVLNVYYNGIQETFQVITESGRAIRCTLFHQFLTNEGWKRLEELNIGSQIYVNGLDLLDNEEWLRHNYLELNRTRKELAEEIGCCEDLVYKAFKKFNIVKQKSDYPNRHGNPNGNLDVLNKYWEDKEHPKGKYHPSYVQNRDEITNTGGYIEANRLYRTENMICEGCNSTSNIEIHHIDKNPKNNDPSNIKFLCSHCHHLHHFHNAQGVMSDRIAYIYPFGFEDVYDLEMKTPYQNYVANGIIVHNSVQSQRFVSMENTDTDEFVYGRYYDNSDMTKNLGDGIYERLYHDALSTYSQLLDLGYKKEEARLVLPNGTPTKMVITMNARELMHYFALRCCKRSQFEHREVAYKMLKLVKRVAPIIFRDAGASCVQLGYCPEIKGCGSYPTLEQIKEVYNKHKGDNENE